LTPATRNGKSGKIRVLIADDHPIVRRGLREMLEEAPDISVEGEAANAAEILEHVRRRKWDVLVLDLNLPDRSGLDVLHDMKLAHPDIPVLFLTVSSEEQFAIRALRAGAAGYLTKETAPEELVAAVRKVVSGGRYVSPAVAERIALHLDDGATRPPHELLSDREYEVFHMLASGRTPTQAAEALHLSVKTISTYRSRILEKMGLSTNAELTVYAVRNGIVS
jgi:DNA-binding NarL/FixJ family response regulator